MRSGRRQRWVLRLAVAVALGVTAAGAGVVIGNVTAQKPADIIWLRHATQPIQAGR